MRRVAKFVLATTLGVTLAGCATDSAIGPNDDLRPAFAVTFDPGSGTGFVGKGDVQLVYNWNNKQLQDNASAVDFRVSSITEEITEWTCTRIVEASGVEIVQGRASTVTTTLQGLFTTVARENSKGRDGPVSGFNLAGYEGTPTIGTVTDGPAVGSCPANPSGFSYDNNATTTTNQLGGGVQVTINGTDWFDIPAPVAP